MSRRRVSVALLIFLTLSGLGLDPPAAEAGSGYRLDSTPMPGGMMGGGMMGGGMMHGGMRGGGMMGSAPPAAGANESGAAIFQSQCAACHTLDAGGANGIGPNLHGLFGRKAGGVAGYGYSSAMARANVTWNGRTLDAFLKAPESVISGNKMPFGGISDERERQRLIGYLRAATR